MTDFPVAQWPLRLAETMPPAAIVSLKTEADELARRSPFGWGHTIDFGPFQMPGMLGDSFLRVCGTLDQWGWWPRSLAGLRVADVGCFTGGLSMLIASRGASKVYAIDEIPEHVSQCALVARAFGMTSVETLTRSAFELRDTITPASLDLILLSGVLYHMSDMLVGLVALGELLKPGGVLLLESNAVECFEHSYANFGRFAGGMWWQPTALCIQDLCSFAGLDTTEVRFYFPHRCIARTVKRKDGIVFKRGMNWKFADIHDEAPRQIDTGIMASAECRHLVARTDQDK